jgi:hypothetical protein
MIGTTDGDGPVGLLRTAGLALHGEWWQQAIARDLGVSPRTVRRWVAGDTRPPVDLGDRLRDLLRAKECFLGQVAEELGD